MTAPEARIAASNECRDIAVSASRFVTHEGLSGNEVHTVEILQKLKINNLLTITDNRMNYLTCLCNCNCGLVVHLQY